MNAVTSKRSCVICMKWGAYFRADDVNMLFYAVRDNLSLDHDFVCITDDPQGLDPAIKSHPLHFDQMEQPDWAHGKWPKLLMFDRRIVADYDAALFLDLDLLVTGQLAPLLNIVMDRGGLFLMPKFRGFIWRAIPAKIWDRMPGIMNMVTRGNSSVVGFVPAEQFHLYDDFDPAVDAARYDNDQNYISSRALRRRFYPKDWCIGLIHLVSYWPFGLIHQNYKKRPVRPKIVIFNGHPKPVELVGNKVGQWGTKRRQGYGPVGWVEEYLAKYGQ
ncbi:MAG: hypothetical protein AAF625_02750 [Pseudomonadota bacterium]